MSPEHAFYGKFSVKSDVFSMGVLLLEVVSGRKNRGFHHSDHPQNLLGHVGENSEMLFSLHQLLTQRDENYASLSFNMNG